LDDAVILKLNEVIERLNLVEKDVETLIDLTIKTKVKTDQHDNSLLERYRLNKEMEKILYG